MSGAKYDFDPSFQRKVAACILKDVQFNKRSFGLIKPDYFESDAEAALVSIGCRYFEKYNTTPSLPVVIQMLKEDIAAKIIRKDLLDDIKATLVELKSEDISDANFVVDQVAKFAKHAAMQSAALEYVELLERGNHEKAAKVIADAAQVGAHAGEKTYNFFGDDEIDQREMLRNDRLCGISKAMAVSTGVRALDKRLTFHGGWGKSELSVLMGAPKAGKSISLAYFAKNAAMLGNNVLFVTLEVSKHVTAERLDASLTGIAMSELKNHIIDAKGKIRELRDKAGKLYIEEFPTGTLKISDLSRVIQKHKGDGVVFDLVVVDYADLMQPQIRTTDVIENSKSIYVDLRALAQIENFALLTAAQTNREGAKATTATMDHVASDFNKIRIPDLVISINATEEEKTRNEARLFFVASRNQAGGFSIHIKQNLETMCFIESVTKIE